MVIGLFLVVVGLTIAVKPSLFWLLTESWKSEDGATPSSLYIWSTRFGGIMMLAAGVGSIVAHTL